MRKLIVNTMLSLDGVMQSPGGPDDDPTGGFSLGGWGATYVDEEMMSRVAESARTSCCSAADLRDLRRALALRRGPDRRPAQHDSQARRLDHPRHRGMEQLHADPRGRRGLRDGAQEPGRSGDPGPRKPRPRPDAARARPRRRVPMWIFPVVIGKGKRFFGGERSSPH